MAITGAGRLTVRQQMSRKVALGGRPLAIEIKAPKGFARRAVDIMNNLPAMLAAKDVEVRFFTPLGLELNTASLIGKTAEQIDVIAAEVDSLSQVAIEKPEMIAISDKLNIMKGEVTVGLFKRVMGGYEITGDNANKLQDILADHSQAGEALTYVSLNDAREFATRLSDLTGRKFRVQTEKEWLAARDRLSGNYATWTETKYDENSFLLRRSLDDYRTDHYPGFRCNDGAVRLVEDLAA